MDTVRSEYSEGSLTSSRMDDGGTTDRGSISFSLSNSHSSRLSIDSATTRSDYFSSYERKFQERKLAKRKKSEKAKREKEKADRQELLSADQRRRAEREAERQARKKEMGTWLTDPNELRRIERRSQIRSRDRMRTLKEWYKPAISGPLEEIQPVFVAAMNQEKDNQEYSRQKKIVKTILSKEAAALKDEEDREALQVVLHKQLTAFTSKLEYLEQITDISTNVQVRAKTRAGPRRRRRIAREDMVLAPLAPTRNLKTTKSVATLPTNYNVKGERKLATSTSLQMLRSISREQDGNQNVEEALDDAAVEAYLLRHRKGAKLAYAAIKLQATWRMYLCRRKYIPWRHRRTRHRRAIFEIWVMTYKVGYRAQRSLLRKYFTAWHAHVVEALQLREMELHLFRQAATQTELPRMVLNLVFTSDWEDERAKRLAAKAAEAAKKKEIAPSSKAAFLNAFLSATFGDVESSADKGRSRVHQLRTQHVAAREEIRKKIVQHVFRLWKRVHESNKRVGLNAQLCLKRAVRMAFGTRQRWPAEILLSVFEIWARWASFNRCRRLGLPLPQFIQSIPHWDIWLHNYQERQVRCVKAAAKAPGARLRRFFLRLHAFAKKTIRERYVLALASKHYDITLRRNVLLEWRAAIADSAAEKKLTRGVMLRMHRYANAKRKLRPLKQALRQRQCEWSSRRAWRAWKNVQLHACFKRELNLSRLENSPAWRSRLHRIVEIWRDERNSLLLWRTFEAWTHFVRKRKLFLTLRLLCTRLQRRNLLFGVFNAWKAAKWDRVDGFLEDDLRLDAWDSYRELSAFFPMMFYGSFSDAASIFGGLPTNMYGENMQRMKQDNQELMLSTSGDAVRHFHGVLVRDSVMEVRNAILQTQHLINAVDESSGNTALHVATQIEEPERRFEIVSLLLSEGAATLRRVNRHGLSPVNLAPDLDTHLLLDKGIFAFHSRNVFDREVVAESTGENQRLLWCMVSLMSREWGSGLRIPANVRNGQWHSTLRDELWLRQTQIRFNPNSTFAPAVSRSRGFLNALKTRLCVLHHDFLLAIYSHKRSRIIADPRATREQRYANWEELSKIKTARANEVGEYAPYARYLLATTLDTDACEQELIPSFVGLLFSLEFSIDDVLSQAYRLEGECVAAEGELWKLYQRIQNAEKSWSKLLARNVQATALTATTDVGMLRLFSDDEDADLFFRREIFLLEFEEFNSSDHDVSQDGMNIQQKALTLEIDTHMIRTKRKLRKAEKKIKRVQDEIDEKEKAYREALFTSTRRVEDICVTRMALEHSHLRMAKTLIKYNKVKEVVARLEYAKLVLQSEAQPSIPVATRPVPDEFSPYDTLSFSERKTLLNKEMARYRRMFQTKVTLEHATANTDESNIEQLPEALHPLQKEAVCKLHKLLVTNLLRMCCCWLAENMIAMEEADKAESFTDSDSEASDGESILTTEPTCSTGRVSRVLSTAGVMFGEGMTRRRSSIHNTRRVLENYQGSSSLNLFDPDSDTMNATYEASATLLFEEERRAAQEAEQARLNIKKVEVIPAISERNPVTGQLEVPPDHIVNIDAIQCSEAMGSEPVVKTKVVPRNRKKEELQRAMIHRRLQNKRNDDEDDNLDSSHDNLLPVIHGTNLHFGNFVVGNGVSIGNQHLQVTTFSNEAVAESHNSASTEAMWKRGGIKLVDNTAPSIKEVLAKAHRVSISREKLRPGSRRQGVTMQTPPEVSQPLEEVQESTLERKNSQKPSQLDEPENEVEKPKRSGSIGAARFPFDRATSTSRLMPVTMSLTEVGPESNVNEDQLLSSDDGNVEELSCVQEAEKLTTPAVENKTPSRQNSASSVRTGQKEQVDTAAPSSQLDNFDHGGELARNVSMDNNETNPDVHVLCNVDICGDDDNEPLQVEKFDQLIQSPIVEISTSRTSELASERYSSRKLTVATDESCVLQSDSLVSSVNAFVKWEEGAIFEVFPLAVTLTNQSNHVVAGNRQNSINREKIALMPRVGSLQILKTRTASDDFTASRFVLEHTTDTENLLELSTEDTNEDFSLQGKSVKMAKKQIQTLRKSSTTGSIDARKLPILPPKQAVAQVKPDTMDNSNSNSPDSAPLVRPISVTVVTKPSKHKVEVPEVVLLKPTLELPLEKPNISPPKPFVKFDGGLERENDVSTGLQLEGMGLTGPVFPKNNVEVSKLDGSTKVETNMPPHGDSASSHVRASQSRSRPPQASISELFLLGARVNAPKSSDSKRAEYTGFEDMTPLSKAEKERLWQQFATEPLSTSVQDAYTILYPQTYAGSAPDSQRQQNVQTTPNNTSATRKKSSISTEQLSGLSLRVNSTRQPIQKAIKLDRKFWSAVEGYRAIGSSSLIPLDAATIFQRRRDKAQAIFDQFFRGHTLGWLDMCPNEVEEVRRQLGNAPKGLFDELQRTAELQISAALTKRQKDKSSLVRRGEDNMGSSV